MKLFSLFYFIFYFGHAALGITPASIVFNFLHFFSSGIEFLTTPPPEGIGPSGFTWRRWIRAMEMIWKFQSILLIVYKWLFLKYREQLCYHDHGTCIFIGLNECHIMGLVFLEVLKNSFVWKWFSFVLREISLGIIGNLACHEDLLKHIVSTNGLIEIVVDQLFSEDSQCLCEACW